jgi:hypothetical protein
MRLFKGWVVLKRLLQTAMFKFGFIQADGVMWYGWKCGSRGEELKLDMLALYL